MILVAHRECLPSPKRHGRPNARADYTAEEPARTALAALLEVVREGAVAVAAHELHRGLDRLRDGAARRGLGAARRDARVARLVVALDRADRAPAARAAPAPARHFRRQLREPVAAAGALFFSLPFVIGATQSDLGQIAFAASVGVAALVSTIDPLYERWIAKRAARRLLFHAYCSWIAALVVLPMVLLAAARAGFAVVACAPWSSGSCSRCRCRGARCVLGVRGTAWLASVIVVPIVVWELRAQVPAAGLAVMRARITQSIESSGPGPRRDRDPALGARGRRDRIRGDPCARRPHAAGHLRVASQRARSSESPRRFMAAARRAGVRSRASRSSPRTRSAPGPWTS